MVNRRAQGLRAWFWQRLSSVYMVLYLLPVGAFLLLWPPDSHAAWRAWLAQPLVGLATALFFAALLVHAWVGMRDVLMDYVHPLALRLALLCVVALLLAGSGLWLLGLLFSVFMER